MGLDIHKKLKAITAAKKRNERRGLLENQGTAILDKCPICGSTDYTTYLKASCPRTGDKKQTTLVKCHSCSMIFNSPMISQEQIIAAYHPDYEQDWGKYRSLKQKAEFILAKRLPRTISPGSLLDIGCGTGAYLAAMEKNNWDVVGVDPWAKDYQGRQLHPKVSFRTLKEADFDDESFDVVTMWWVIEHLPDPLSELREVRRIIKPGGTFAISTSNIESLEARLFGKYWHHLVQSDHCCHFTPAVLSNCLRLAGFETVIIRHCMLTAGVIGSLDGYLKEKGINLNLVNIFTTPLGLPFEITAALLKKSGLFTIIATPAMDA